MKTEIQNIETQSLENAAPVIARPTSRRSRYLVIAVVAAILAIGLLASVIPRILAQEKLAATARGPIAPIVTVTNAIRADHAIGLTLPGDVHAYQETEIFARADGYLLKWNKDIGTKVEAGQVLAEIDTPELDQELNRARAALTQTEANVTLARSSAERWQGLLRKDAVSQQEMDEKNGALAAREADVKAAKAVVSRLETLASYKEVRAPFGGTVTRRSIDTGALIRGGANGNATALFQLAQMDTLRVRVNVPQAYMRDVTVGSPVSVHVAQFPDRVFAGKVARTSGAFDPVTRTLLTEIELPNHDGVLSSGIHVEVELSLSQANPPLVAPAASVMTGSAGPEIAVVNAADTVHLQKIQLGRDFGSTVEIVGGLGEGARIVVNPSDTLADGMLVKVAGETKAKGNQVAKM